MRLKHRTYTSLFLIGPMGVGKTTIGRHLAKELSLKFIDSDSEIEFRAGADISWIFDVEGEAGFRERENKVIEELSQRKHILLATGGGAVLREDNRQYLRSRGYVVFLDTSVETQLARTKKDRKRPLLQNVDQNTVLREMKTKRDPLYLEVADLRVFVGEANSRRVVSNILSRMQEQGVLE